MFSEYVEGDDVWSPQYGYGRVVKTEYVPSLGEHGASMIDVDFSGELVYYSLGREHYAHDRGMKCLYHRDAVHENDASFIVSKAFFKRSAIRKHPEEFTYNEEVLVRNFSCGTWVLMKFVGIDGKGYVVKSDQKSLYTYTECVSYKGNEHLKGSKNS